MACQEGFEPPTCGLEVRCSVHLSYWHAELVVFDLRGLRHLNIHDVTSAYYIRQIEIEPSL